LIQKKHDLFVHKGESALSGMKQINSRLNELLSRSEKEFPLSQAQASGLRTNLRDILVKIKMTEEQAVDALQRAIV
jgi:hypothetical protein